MVKFIQKLDRNKKIYIPKPLREAGFNKSLEILPSYKAAILYPSDADFREVEVSVKILLQEIKNRISPPTRECMSTKEREVF